jgi:hypothetical protein
MSPKYHADILAAYLKFLSAQAVSDLALNLRTFSDETAEEFDRRIDRVCLRTIEEIPAGQLSLVEYLVNQAIANDDLEQNGVTV